MIPHRHPKVCMDACLSRPGESFLFTGTCRRLSVGTSTAAIPENTNTMLHVILGNRRKPEAGLRSLTIVCGDLSGEMKSMIDEIEIAFREATLENTSWM